MLSLHSVHSLWYSLLHSTLKPIHVCKFIYLIFYVPFIFIVNFWLIYFFLFSFFLFPVVLLLDDMGASGTCSYMLRHTPIPMGLPSVPTMSSPRVGSSRHLLGQCSWISRDLDSESLTFFHVIATSYCHTWY
jgi:hypothetical protein